MTTRMSPTTTTVLCAVILLFFSSLSFAAGLLLDDQTVVHTSYGSVRGFFDITTLNEVLIFQGVPFGAPTSGANRFRAPQPPQPWSGVRNAFKPVMCAQLMPNVLDSGFMVGFEDCLYVDVYTPLTAVNAQRKSNGTDSDALRPVMVFIYGGAFTMGDKMEYGMYDGRYLARKHNVVVVTVNYRVGPLGFLALDGLRAESGLVGGSGNQGLLDQRLALQWVQQNIARFGGKPDKVTIFGESAGAMSVCAQLVSEASAGLFHAAIMESGSCDSDTFFVPYEQARQWSAHFTELVGCNHSDAEVVLACMRKKDLHSIFGAIGKLSDEIRHARPGSNMKQQLGFKLPTLFPLAGFVPAIDGTAVGLRDRPLNLIAKGAVKVPVILGTNKDEGTMFSLLFKMVVPGGVHNPITDADLDRTLEHVYGHMQIPGVTSDKYSVADAIKAEYRTDPSFDGQPHTVFVNAVRDFFFACSARRTARALLSSGVRTYQYFFSYSGHGVTTPLLGVHHGAELPFVFSQDVMSCLKLVSHDRSIISMFGQYWTNFAGSLNPNGSPAAASSSLVEWLPLNGTDSDHVLEISLDAGMRDSAFLYSHCELMDQVQAQLV